MNCKDCSTASRPAPYPGPRCATHHRAKVKAAGKRAHELKVQKVYGLLDGEYDNLYKFQGGKCAICLVATGKSKRLAVDHDHKTGRPRGLLCSEDNRMLGRYRDNPNALLRAVNYLVDPPYNQLKAVDDR